MQLHQAPLPVVVLIAIAGDGSSIRLTYLGSRSFRSAAITALHGHLHLLRDDSTRLARLISRVRRRVHAGAVGRMTRDHIMPTLIVMHHVRLVSEHLAERGFTANGP